MKNLVLVMAVVFIAASLTGCGKKKEETAGMEGLNSVVSDNVLSVPEVGAGNAVMVDNAQAMTNEAAVPASETAKVQMPAGKPTGKQIQQALKSAGFYSGRIDGDVGPKTKKAIEAFQAANGLKADGKVGPRTWRALSAHLGKAAEVANPSADAQAVGQ